MSGLQCIIVDVNGGWTLHHPKSKKGLRQGSALTTDTGGRLLKHSARPYRSSESSDDGLLTPTVSWSAEPTPLSRDFTVGLGCFFGRLRKFTVDLRNQALAEVVRCRVRRRQGSSAGVYPL